MSDLIMWALSGGFWRFAGFMIIVGMFLRAILYLIEILLKRDISIE